MKLIFALLLCAAAALAQAPHANALAWTWTPDAGSDPATGFYVQSGPCAASGCAAAGAYVTIATLAATATTYTDSTPVAGQTTWYQVIAFNPGGQLVSNSISLATPFLPPAGSLKVSGSAK
jgi:hypothetical protein